LSSASAPARFFVAVLLLGLDLRTVFGSLPPLLDHVRADLGLSAGVAGLLTTGPLLCFGALAPLGPRLIRRVSIEWVLVAAAVLTAAGAALRGAGGVAGLFAGTLAAGAAVAVAQTVVPTLVRTQFGAQAGSLTGVFSLSLTLGGAAAAATAVPFERLFGSWRGSLAVYGVAGLAAAAAWVPTAARERTVVPRTPGLALHRLRGSWSIAGYFGLQAAAFYGGLTWIPSILEAHGFSEAGAGALLALGNVVQVPFAFLVPVLAARRRRQTSLLVVLVVLGVAGYAGLLVAPHAAIAWMIVLGVAQGGALGLALILPVVRGGDGAAVAALTAMALTVGYLIAATAPFAVGLAHDLSGGWHAALMVLIAITAAELVVALPATRDWTVGSAAGELVEPPP
jgi:CP family cyanate transporter-like MFS transporter